MNKILAVLFLSFCNLCFAGTMRHDVPENKYIEFGNKFYCVKKIIGVTEENNNKTYSIGSCVILNSNWVITCAHLVEEKIDYIYIEIEGQEYIIDKFIVNKDYSSEKMQADIAIGFCKKGFGNIAEPELYETKIKINDYCSFAGYGRYGNMLVGAKKYDGKIRGGTNIIDSYFKKDMVIISGSKDNTKTQLEFLPNVGDSGGGLFIRGKLAGITSLILSKDKIADSNYGDEGAFVQIYPYLDWIKKYVQKK